MSTCRSTSVIVNGLNTKYSKTLTIFTLSTSLECTKFTAQTYSHIPNKIKFRHQGCMEWSLYKNSNGHGSDTISIASHSHCAISVSCWKAPLSSWSIRKQFQHGRCRVTYIYSNYVTLLSHSYVSRLSRYRTGIAHAPRPCLRTEETQTRRWWWTRNLTIFFKPFPKKL